jgi:mannan endo-1,6-alpha-mannosidase
MPNPRQWNISPWTTSQAVLTISQTNGSSLWQTRVQGLLTSGISLYFNNDSVMYEQACENTNTCDTDQLSFKAYYSRWLAATTKSAPFTYNTIMPLLRSSATAAALQCDGTAFSNACGFKWIDGATWDGTNGIGQQMSALEVIQANLIVQANVLVTNTTGGTSVGDSSAGTGSSSTGSDGITDAPVTTGEKAGAGILTFGMVSAILGGTWLMISEVGG